MDDNQNRQQSGGSGSAENTGKERADQRNTQTDPDKSEKQNISSQMGKGPNPLSSTRDMGGKSGRDDLAGGDNDGMSDANSNDATSSF